MKKIREILDASELQDLAELNGLQPIEQGITVGGFRKSDDNGTYPAEEECSFYVFRPDSIPEFVRSAIGYDEIQYKSVNYGLNRGEKRQ